MENRLLLILLALCALIFIAVCILLFGVRRRELRERLTLEQKQQEIALLKQQLSYTYDKDQSLLLKSQQAADGVDALSRQFQTLYNQLKQITRDSALSLSGMDQIQKHIAAMNQVMVNKKARGNWGEYQLLMLLQLYAGDAKEVYESQFTLDNGMIADAALHLPNSDRVLAIDSKFPMEYYQSVVANEADRTAQERSAALFRTGIKKHINDIARKYITPQTSDQAVMFVPSEAVYTFICGECSDLLDYAYQKRVLLTSPTTLIGVVFTLVNATKDARRAAHINEVEKTVVAMQEDAGRLVQRVEKSMRFLQQALKSVEEAHISSRKLARRIEKVSEGDIETREPR